MAQHRPEAVPPAMLLVAGPTPAAMRPLRELLTGEGFGVRSATGGQEALELVAESRPTLILLGNGMPGMDAYAVCEHFKADEALAHIPVILVCDSGEVADRAKVFGVGAADYITRPFAREEVLARVQAHLAIGRAKAQSEMVSQELGAARAEYERARAALAEQIQELESGNTALRETKARFEAVYDHHFQLTGLLDAQGRLLMANRRAAEFAGVAEDDLIGMPFVETPFWAHSRDARLDLLDAIRRALGGESVHFETTHVSVTGEIRDFDFCVSPVFDDDGNVIYLVPEGYDITERKSSERALRESEARYRGTMECAGEAIFLCDSTGGIVDVNRRAYEGSGYTREELLTMHVTDIEESLDEEGIRRLWDRLNGEELAGEPVTLEGIHRYRDGRRLPVEVRVGLVELGTETLMLALVRDITSRKRAENELREREEMIRALVETSQDWIWSIDLQGTHTYCNPAVESILGYRPDELVDKPALSLVHDEDRAKIEAMLPACIAGKRGWTNLLSRWRARNGGWRFLESNAVPILDENGELVGFRGVDRDTTDRKQAEEALRKSEATYRTFFENSCDAIQILVNGVFVDYNAATVALLGYADRTELVNTTPEGLSPEHQPDGRESAEKAREMVETARRQGTHRFEWDHMGKDGEILPVEVALTALSRDGDATLYSVWRDLRGRKQAEEEREALEAQLRQSQKMEAIGKLAGGVAHDFNNLLQAILGYGEMALEETEEGSTLQEDLLEVVKAGNSATVLTRQLLAFSRRQVLSLEVVDLHDVVEEIAKMIRRVIGEHIALRIVAAPGLKLVYADRGQLEQILMNLCVNARDAMPEGGELTVRTAAVELDDAFCQTHGWGAPGRCVQLSVKDTGVGMDEETQRRIFEPFYTTKESGKGTGLGLSTVYGIVRQHNGLVLVRSEPGKGSAFRVFLPPSRGRAEGQREAAAATPSGGTEVILLAEDSESVRLLGTRFLETAGYTVLAAADGHEAIRVFDAHRDTIDMAMLDVVMPGCSGRAVLHHIRESGSSIPALVASGYSSSQLQEGLAIEEDVERIAKPYQRGELLRRIREILDA